jgi:hypothetical protein
MVVMVRRWVVVSRCSSSSSSSSRRSNSRLVRFHLLAIVLMLVIVIAVVTCIYACTCTARQRISSGFCRTLLHCGFIDSRWREGGLATGQKWLVLLLLLILRLLRSSMVACYC